MRLVTHTDRCNVRTADREEIVEFLEGLEHLYHKSYKDSLAIFGADSKYTQAAWVEWHAVMMVVYKLLH